MRYTYMAQTGSTMFVLTVTSWIAISRSNERYCFIFSNVYQNSDTNFIAILSLLDWLPINLLSNTPNFWQFLLAVTLIMGIDTTVGDYMAVKLVSRTLISE